MAKKKSSTLKSGQKVRINDAVAMPEFPELSIGSWTGTVLETQGRGATTKVILQWDDAAMSQMSDAYKQHCESQHLLPEMACLPATDVSIEE